MVNSKNSTKKGYTRSLEEAEIILDNIPGLVFYKDEKNNLIRVNKYFADAHKTTKEALAGKNCFDIYPKDVAQKYFDDDLEVIKSKKPKLNFIEPWDVVEGRRWLNSNKIPLYDDDGKCIGIIGFSTDVTEQVKEEQKLKQAQNQLNSIFSNLKDTIFVISEDYKILFKNENAHSVFGEDLVGRNCFEVIKGEEQVCDNCPIQNLSTSDVCQIRSEQQVYAPISTEIKIFDVITTSIENYNGKKAYLELLRDITERKKVEQKLKESEEFHRLITENMNDLINVIDNKFRVEYINEEVHMRILGNAKEDALGKNILDFVHPDDKEKGLNSLLKGIKDKKGGPVEIRVANRKGQYIWVEIKGGTFLNNKGELKGIVVGRDITERKKAENEIKNLAKFPAENPNPVLRVSKEIVLYANEAGESIFTIKPDDIIPTLIQEGVNEAFSTSELKTIEIEVNDSIYSFDITPISEEGYANVYGRDITERKKAEDENTRKTAINEAINEIFQMALTTETDEEIARICLEETQKITRSKFGYIGEINQEGKFDTIALSNPGWDICRIPKSEAVVLIQGMEIKGYWGKAITERHSVIVNDPALHPDAQGTPEGHPPITSFLGVPMKQAGQVIGLIGIANKEGGYDLHDQEAVETLSVALIEALMRKRAEIELEKHRDHLDNLVQERVKELNCLYGLSKIIEEKDITKEEILKKAVKLIPPAWQFSDITCARIQVESKEYKTENFKKTEWKQSSDIFVANKKIGVVEVYYLEKMHEFDEGPFLKEERYLLNALAERLGKDFERINAELKVIESEKWLSATLESIGDAVIATDAKGNISFLNPVAESLTGWKRDEAIGKPIEDVFNIVNEKTRKRVESPVSRVLREGVVVGLANHTILIAKNGKEIPIADSGAPLKGDKGDTIGVVLVFRDITEQRRAEHIIEERIKELNCLYSISKIVEEEFIEINELLSQSVVFLPPAWQFPDVACARIVVDGQEYKTDNFKETKWKQASDIIIDKEKIGTVEICYLDEMPEFDEGPFLKEERHLIDNIAAVLGIYLERKKKEEVIRLQSEIIENMSEGVYLIKLDDGTIVYTNPAFEEIFGYNPGEMIGKDVAIVNAPIDKKPEETKNEIMGILKDTGEWHGEVLNIKKDGTPFWCYANVSLFDHPEYGRVIISVHTDITERKKAEKEMNNALEEIKRSNAELEQFAYIASHDLQEPLRMVSGFANLLEKRYKESLDKDAHEFIDFIIDGASRMHDLINNLLNYSKIGKSSREFEKVDLNDVLKDVIDNLRQIINETNAEIIYDSLPSIYGDKYHLLQVFQNLISNAIKFRGIDFPLISISAKPDGKHWVFSISDNGIGIDSKDFERIFIIFKRLHITGKYEGTGIGLAICKKIIEYHRGKIWVESEVGKGSNFYFSIPKEIDIKS